MFPRGDNVPEAESKEKPSQATQTQAQTSSQNQYVPDKKLRRVCLEEAEKSEEKKK
jgi:hypothetical protein